MLTSDRKCRNCWTGLGYQVGSICDYYDHEKLCPRCAAEVWAEAVLLELVRELEAALVIEPGRRVED